MMKFLLFSLCLLHVCAGMNLRWFEYEPVKNEKVDELEGEWRKFKSFHNKVYGQEEALRKSIFTDNLNIIKEHNKLHAQGFKSFTLAVNEFADMTLSEFTDLMNGFKGSNNNSTGSTYLPLNLPLTLPTSVDWRKKPGMVSRVKNQGGCGSCWAFSATGSLEGQHFRKTGIKTELSEQNLVDCSSHYGNYGCRGGLMVHAFKYVRDNHGIDTEQSYPYKAKKGECKFSKENVGAEATGFKRVKYAKENDLKEVVATVGPVSNAIDASHHSFMFYNQGIYDEPRCSHSRLDHGVLTVGYGTKDGHDYWIVKNSWSSGWGEKGYIRMVRNHGNQCGIATLASFPLV